VKAVQCRQGSNQRENDSYHDSICILTMTGVERIDATQVIANYKDCHAVLLPCSLLKSSGISAIIPEFDVVLTASLSHHEQSDPRTATKTRIV